MAHGEHQIGGVGLKLIPMLVTYLLDLLSLSGPSIADVSWTHIQLATPNSVFMVVFATSYPTHPDPLPTYLPSNLLPHYIGLKIMCVPVKAS